MITSTTWIRPLGRWYRLLLLLAGDVEQNPGPQCAHSRAPRGDLNLIGGFAQATSDRMAKCLKAFGLWCETHAGLTLEQVVENVEITNLALKACGLALFKRGSPRYMLVYAITAELGRLTRNDNWKSPALVEPCFQLRSSALFLALSCFGGGPPSLALLHLASEECYIRTSSSASVVETLSFQKIR